MTPARPFASDEARAARDCAFAAAALPALCCPAPGGKAMGKKRKRRDDAAEGDVCDPRPK